MTPSNESDRRYTLHKKGGWLEIHADHLDREFMPDGLWVAGPAIGKFRTREDAATFMRGYLAELEKEAAA